MFNTFSVGTLVNVTAVDNEVASLGGALTVRVQPRLAFAHCRPGAQAHPVSLVLRLDVPDSPRIDATNCIPWLLAPRCISADAPTRRSTCQVFGSPRVTAIDCDLSRNKAASYGGAIMILFGFYEAYNTK